MTFHNDMNVNIADFDLEVLKRSTGFIQTRLAKATLIARFRPELVAVSFPLKKWVSLDNSGVSAFSFTIEHETAAKTV